MLLKFDYIKTQAFFIACLGMSAILYLTPVLGVTSLYRYLYIFIAILSISIYCVRYIKSKKDLTFHKVLLILVAITITLIFMIKVFKFFACPILWAIFIIVMSDREILVKALNYFSWMFAISVIPSILLYPFVVMGYDIFYIGTVDPVGNELKEAAGTYYKNYILSFGLSDFYGHLDLSGGLFRLSGLFDEAGVVGTLAGLILAARKYHKDILNIIIGIAGLLSLSMAFYVMVIVYFLVTLKPSKLIAFILIFVVLFSIADTIPELHDMLTSRFAIEDGKLAGDDRTTEDFDIAFALFLFSPDVWMGTKDPLTFLEYGGSSWKHLLVYFGIFGTISILIFFTLYFMFNIKYKISCYWPFLLIYLLNLYQRPIIFNATYFLIFAGAIAYENYINEKNNQANHVQKKTKRLLITIK